MRAPDEDYVDELFFVMCNFAATLHLAWIE